MYNYIFNKRKRYESSVYEKFDGWCDERLWKAKMRFELDAVWW